MSDHEKVVSNLTLDAILPQNKHEELSMGDELSPEIIHDMMDSKWIELNEAKAQVVQAQSRVLTIERELGQLAEALQLAQDKNPGV